MEEGVEEIPLGLYLVKGDQMCVKMHSKLLLFFLFGVSYLSFGVALQTEFLSLTFNFLS